MPALLINLSEAEIETLRYERYAYPHPMIQKRIFAVYLKAISTYSNKEIGSICGLHPNTVSHWISVYGKMGYEGLLSNNYGTNQSLLEAYSDSLLDCFTQQPPRSSREAAGRIWELTGIWRSDQQVRTFMKRHGLQFIKCGHIPAKANNEEQHKWVEQRLQPAIEAAKSGKVHLLFVDAAHFVLQPFLCCLWCLARIFVKAASGRNRINVLGAVHAISKKVVTLCNTTYINAETLAQFLKLLKKQFCDKPIVVVLDNSPQQRCAMVKKVAKSLDICLLYLPPYSPNLNIIERLWKFAKKKILYARYYGKPNEFHAAILDFFKKINKNFNGELKTLLTLKFHFFDNENSLIYPL
jgi:transposase